MPAIGAPIGNFAGMARSYTHATANRDMAGSLRNKPLLPEAVL